MDAEMFFQHLATPADRTKPLARRFPAAVVSPQIGQCLFALEDRSDAGLFWLGAIGCHVGAIPALRQGDFRSARRVALRLRPNESKTFQADVCVRFAATNSYWRVHSASSFAQ
jgi:hypothetical protein